MSIRLRCFSGGGIEFYTGDPGHGKYGCECKSLSHNRCNTPIGEYGRKQSALYLCGDWNYFKCIQKSGKDGRARRR